MTDKIRNNSILTLFLIIYLTSSFVICYDVVSSGITIILWLITLALIARYRIRYLDKSIAIPFVSLVITLCISAFVNGDTVMSIIKIVFSFATCFLYANLYDFSVFRASYIKVMKFISVISLIGFFTFIIIPQLNKMFVVTGTLGVPYSNLFLYVDAVRYTRNCGLFWEPGAFQTFLILALILSVTNENEPLQITDIMLFTITVITTFSTSGYIALVGVYLLLINRYKEFNSNLKIFLFLIIVALMVFVYLNSDLLFNTATNTVFGKIIKFFTHQEYNTTANLTSTSIRYYAIIKPIEAFFVKPILGMGYFGLRDYTYTYTLGMNTCTFVNWFATYGIFFGCVMISGIYKISKKITKNRLMCFLVIIILFIITGSENYVNNGFVVLFVLYGFKSSILGGKPVNESVYD